MVYWNFKIRLEKQITMSVKIKKIFSNEINNLDAAGLLRADTPVVQTDDMKAHIGGNTDYINFIGNDVLGWSSNYKVQEAAKEALSKYGTGSTSSRTSIGTLDIVKTLEEKLARFLGLDDCIVFPSSYMANIGLFEPLTDKTDTIFIDEMCNPALFDGVRLSSANVIVYKHEDYEDLEYHLKCSQNSRFRIIVTDGVFSTDGTCARLNIIQKLKNTYDAITIVDDSFGIGVLGESGRGTFNHLRLTDKPELMTGTFANALGNVSGGFVSGDKDLLKWLRQTSKAYILSEPISPINTAIVLQVIEILEEKQFNLSENRDKSDFIEENSVIERLHSKAKYIRSEILQKNWLLVRNDYPFISINVGSTLNAQKMVETLFEKDILVSALCYPNTPEGASLLRVNLSANHSKEQIDQLIISITEAFTLLE